MIPSYQGIPSYEGWEDSELALLPDAAEDHSILSANHICGNLLRSSIGLEVWLELPRFPRLIGVQTEPESSFFPTSIALILPFPPTIARHAPQLVRLGQMGSLRTPDLGGN